MVSYLFFYQLVLIALVWLCVMLHWAWPSDPAVACSPPELPPLLPKRKREPTPFAGLTTKPHCDACEYAAPARKPPQLRHHASCPRGGDVVRSIPPPIAARIRTAGTRAGQDGGISAPMAIPMGAPGANCSAS